MGIRYEWDDERQIVMNIFIETPWSWSEFNAMMDVLMPLVRDTKHPCSTVVDCSQMGAIPRDGNLLTMLMNVEKVMPPNVFGSAIVAAPYGVGVFMNILMKLRPRAQRLAIFSSSMKEAHERLYARYQEQYARTQKGT